MGATYSSPDSSYTQLCVVYRCAACGGTHTVAGRRAGFLPRGWARSSASDCFCPGCEEKRHDAHRSRGAGSSRM